MSNFTDIAAVAANRNDDLLRFADAIVAATEAGVSVDAIRSAIDKTLAPQPVRRTVKKSVKSTAPAADKAVKSTDNPQEFTVKSTDWKSKPASKKQVARVVAIAAKVGKHTMRNVKTGEMMPIDAENVATMTAGGASKLYQALKGLTIDNLHLDATTMAHEADVYGNDPTGGALGQYA